MTSLHASFLPESSVLISGVVKWHEHHKAARDEISRRLNAGQEMLLAAPSLVETYSVLTRLPPPKRLGAQLAVELIISNYLDRGTVVAMPPREYREFFQLAASRLVSGGRTYDAIIAATAKSASAGVLLTFNRVHFVGLVDGLEIVLPTG